MVQIFAVEMCFAILPSEHFAHWAQGATHRLSISSSKECFAFTVYHFATACIVQCQAHVSCVICDLVHQDSWQHPKTPKWIWQSWSNAQVKSVSFLIVAAQCFVNVKICWWILNFQCQNLKCLILESWDWAATFRGTRTRPVKNVRPSCLSHSPLKRTATLKRQSESWHAMKELVLMNGTKLLLLFIIVYFGSKPKRILDPLPFAPPGK